MLLPRILTALALLALAVPAMFLAPVWVWGLFSLMFLSIGAAEWSRLLKPSDSPWRHVLTVLGIGSLVLVAREQELVQAAHLVPILGIAAVYWVGFAWRRLRDHDARTGGWPLAALLLIACWVSLYELRRLGPEVLLVGMAVVWLADIGAYFVGRALGRRKLAPSISPGKSWEGAAAGAVLVILAGALAALHDALGSALPARLYETWGSFAGSLTLGGIVALSIIGDLHESLLKRQAGVKDSGRSLPGHGGVLDRIDALLPTMPVVLLLHLLLR